MISRLWVDCISDIDFKSLEPDRTTYSSYSYEEFYLVDGETYRLIYVIADPDRNPLIEKLISEIEEIHPQFRKK